MLGTGEDASTKKIRGSCSQIAYCLVRGRETQTIKFNISLSSKISPWNIWLYREERPDEGREDFYEGVEIEVY